jgi:hypothetical protein
MAMETKRVMARKRARAKAARAMAGCQKATTELSLRNSQSLSHLRYPTDTRQLSSPQGEADGVSGRGMTLQALGGGEFALRLVSRQRVAPLYCRSRTHTHTTQADRGFARSRSCTNKDGNTNNLVLYTVRNDT